MTNAEHEIAARIHQARASKVEALVAELDRMTREAGHDPIASAGGIANMLRSWSDLRWRQLAISCGKRPPSEVSKALVVGTFVARIKGAAK
jgi:hypothetical protein